MILVIGSNSFSGSWMCKHLLDHGADVLGMGRRFDLPCNALYPAFWSKQYRSNFRYERLDLNSDEDCARVPAMLKKYGVTEVINFAAQGMVAESWVRPVDWYRTNVLGQVSLLEKLRQHETLNKYVHVSTPEVYGSTDEWIFEDFDFNPTTPYAISRAAFDMHLKAYEKAYGFPVCWTRAANVYGPGQQLYRIVPRAFLSAFTGVQMHLDGGGVSERSFIHISDVCSATKLIMESAQVGETFHISTDRLISIRNLVEKIFEMKGADFNQLVLVGEERLGKDAAYKLDSTKLRIQTGWKDRYGLNEGLSDVASWVEHNLSVIGPLNWSYEHRL